MGRQTGLIRVSGNIGGVSFYKSNGEDLARVANGPSADKIQNDSNFARTRENNTEFGGSATIAKSLRLAFATSLLTMADNRLVSRLTALFKEICSKSTGVRGQRPIVLSTNRTMLNGLDFNIKLSFGSVFNPSYTLAINAGRTAATLTIPAFSPQTSINAPSGATHFRLIAAIGSVSDFQYNVATGKYEATDPLLDKLNGIAYGAVTSLTPAAPVNFTLAPTLTGAGTMTATVSGVLALGIEFYQRVGTVDYILAQGNAMKIINVF